MRFAAYTDLSEVDRARCRSMRESMLEECVRSTCAHLGLLRYHTKDSRRSESGFPDDVIVGPYGLLMIELKSQGGRMTETQETWQDALVHVLAPIMSAYAVKVQVGQRMHVRVATWKPSDWVSGKINYTLGLAAGNPEFGKQAWILTRRTGGDDV